jgi:2-polyprenyl-6-methoxyphenol hydroxylase-like FAD-dependent oxidoreductase
MTSSSKEQLDVLIVGAGPTGLVLALWLARLGVRLTIIDKSAAPGTTSRALAVQARTLEFYRQLGIADAVVEGGRKVSSANLWVGGKQLAHLSFGDMAAGLSEFSQPVIFPQDEHEQLLVERLSAAGVEVERNTELLSFTSSSSQVTAYLKRSDGSEEVCETAYIAGCDGARSTVREALKIGFPGGSYSHLFYVADVEASGVVLNGELHVDLDPTDFLAVFPLKQEGRARLVGTVSENSEHQHTNLSWNDVSAQVLERMQINVHRVNWFSTYRVHHRVAEHFRNGRAFLLGDAAHIHSPVGGQGMNTGIGDAVNLAWKLRGVLHGGADTSLLDSYEAERIIFARRLVSTTDRAFTGVTSSGAIARRLRMDVVPRLIPFLFKLKPVRRFLFRTISQTAVNYRDSNLSEGRAGSVHGGDRLPWVKVHMDGEDADNFKPLTSLKWQVHIYGTADTNLQKQCEDRRLPLHIFPWHLEMGQAGLLQNAIYLVRPDGYVALASPEGNASTIATYFYARELVLVS